MEAAEWNDLVAAHHADIDEHRDANIDGTGKAGKSDLIVDFESAYGIRKLLKDTTWSPLHTAASMNIVTADLNGSGMADVIVNFGAAGLWEYANNTNWFQMHNVMAHGFLY